MTWEKLNALLFARVDSNILRPSRDQLIVKMTLIVVMHHCMRYDRQIQRENLVSKDIHCHLEVASIRILPSFMNPHARFPLTVS